VKRNPVQLEQPAAAGWAITNGQLPAIALDVPSFEPIGTFYGGEGIDTFALAESPKPRPHAYGARQ
jgi:microcystin-dependent protein